MPDWLTIIFMVLLGSCVGSFLNVVIYRIPKGISIIHPPSNCPFCNGKIRWYDNIPVLSFLALGARCRYCKAPISPRYALVEIITAVMFLAFFDACYKSGMHSWFTDLTTDWPLFLSHLVLLAVLIVCSAMDIEYYIIDIRIAYFAIAVGLILWSITPAEKLANIVIIPIDARMFAGLAGASVGLFLRQKVLMRSYSEIEEEEIESESRNRGKSNAVAVIFLIVFTMATISLIAWSILSEPGSYSFKNRGLLYILWAFLAIIAGLTPKRESDKKIVEMIEEEMPSARAVALKEMMSLLPIIAGFFIGYLLISINSVAEISNNILSWKIGTTQPMLGLSYALAGLFITASFGWFVRIFFTLAFGKEAMGAGDIYILAFIGTIAGPLVAILGFFIGSVIGVFGICVLLLWKTSRALSYGPWIAIGTLTCLLFYNPIMNFLIPAWKTIQFILTGD